MKYVKYTILAIAIASVMPLSGCEKEGPAEKAGEKIDNAADKANEKLKDAAEDAGDAIEDAGDKIEDATDSNGGN